MPNGEEWYLQPIELGYYDYVQLKNGEILIEDIAEINDGMAAAAENRRRLKKASENG